MAEESEESQPLLSSHIKDVEGGEVEIPAWKTVGLGALGNLLEWYDFQLIGIFATQIGEAFFPQTTPTLRLVASFGLFGIAMVFRPLGGILFGYVGDRWGRRFALRLSIIFMAFPTFLIGCMPTYQSIGLAAPMLVICLRVVQGLSSGGEFSTALVYCVEVAPRRQKAMYIALACVSGSGALLASLAASVMTTICTPYQMETWGWRIPFLCGVVLGIVAIKLRRFMPPSTAFEQLETAEVVSENPILDAFTKHKEKMLVTIGILLGSAPMFYVPNLWMPAYLVGLRNPPDAHAYGVNSFLMAIQIIAILCCGFVADRIFSAFKLGFLSSACAAFLAPILIQELTQTTGAIGPGVIQFIFMMLNAAMTPSLMLISILNLKDPETRTTVYGIGYNISIALSSCSSTLLASALISSGKYGGFMVGSYLSLMLGISLCALVYVRFFAADPVLDVDVFDGKDSMLQRDPKLEEDAPVPLFDPVVAEGK